MFAMQSHGKHALKSVGTLSRRGPAADRVPEPQAYDNDRPTA
jgi:hypothetical protein